MTKRKTIAQLEHELARTVRTEGALSEWFLCSTRSAADYEHTVTINERQVLKLTVHGWQRAAGGVVVVSQLDSDWNDFPRYFDDLVSEWERDSAPEIREAARTLRAARDKAHTPV